MSHQLTINNGSLKKLQRMVLTSSTLAQAHVDNPQATKADPENHWLWRMPCRRLEAEPLRDSLLAISGRLDRQLGGTFKDWYVPYVDTVDTKRGLIALAKPSSAIAAYDSGRRSVYLPISRNQLFEFFSLFDYTDPSAVMADRVESTVAPQSLFLLNNKIVRREALHFARRLLSNSDNQDTQRLQQATRMALAREAHEKEVLEGLKICGNILIIDNKMVSMPSKAGATPGKVIVSCCFARMNFCILNDPKSESPSFLQGMKNMGNTSQHQSAFQSLSRRDALQRVGCGFGFTALASLTALEANAAIENPLAPKPGHHPARAKRGIVLFLHGGVSHIDSFDPKPKLTELHGQPSPIDKPKFNFAPTENLLKSPWKFKKYGECGMEVSELFPEIGSIVDDIAFIRSMQSDFAAHGGASLQLFTGDGIMVRPSMGAWALYGLGSENQDLPGFISICPTVHHGGAQHFGTSFLPAVYQGTAIGDSVVPLKSQAGIKNLDPAEQEATLQRRQLDLLAERNRRHATQTSRDQRLEARIKAFELAYRMQMQAPEVLDLSGETKETLELYGINQSPTDDYGRACLVARRLSERGVRFIQVTHGLPKAYWDAHGGLRGNHSGNAKKADKPIAALVKDLKQRGLLQDTLVIFATEFGRTPAAQGDDGRDHHPHAYTMWMAGGGIRGGTVYGATDELGYYVAENRVHTHDFHATILHLMGIDHT